MAEDSAKLDDLEMKQTFYREKKIRVYITFLTQLSIQLSIRMKPISGYMLRY